MVPESNAHNSLHFIEWDDEMRRRTSSVGLGKATILRYLIRLASDEARSSEDGESVLRVTRDTPIGNIYEGFDGRVMAGILGELEDMTEGKFYLDKTDCDRVLNGETFREYAARPLRDLANAIYDVMEEDERGDRVA